MTNCSMKDAVKYGMFEEAKARYEKTTKQWKEKWWNTICEIWEKFEKWQKLYRLDRVTKVVLKIAQYASDRIVTKVPIVFAKGTKLCYLFKFYDSEGNLLFSKVGTTEDTIKSRLSAEIRSYSKKHPVEYAIVESVIDCGDIPPEGAESATRALFIRKVPKSFIKNDRFFGYDIDVKEFNTCVKNYLAKEPSAA